MLMDKKMKESKEHATGDQVYMHHPEPEICTAAWVADKMTYWRPLRIKEAD